LAFLLGMLSAPAMADPENPFLTPEHPTVEDTIFVSAYVGPCDNLQLGFLAPEVEIVDDRITVQLTGEHIIDPIWCTLGNRIEAIAIGSFPSGSYLVTVNWKYFDQVEDVQVTLGVLQLTIDSGTPAGAPIALPSSNDFGLAMLVLLVGAAAAFRVRKLRDRTK
jgi:hypothetical protein